MSSTPCEVKTLPCCTWSLVVLWEQSGRTAESRKDHTINEKAKEDLHSSGDCRVMFPVIELTNRKQLSTSPMAQEKQRRPSCKNVYIYPKFFLLFTKQ